MTRGAAAAASFKTCHPWYLQLCKHLNFCQKGPLLTCLLPVYLMSRGFCPAACFIVVHPTRALHEIMHPETSEGHLVFQSLQPVHLLMARWHTLKFLEEEKD